MQEALQTTIEVRNLDLAYGDNLILRNLNFSVRKGDIFIIMGESGCGKSTLLKALIGLKEPVRGELFYGGKNFLQQSESERQNIMRKVGVLYQSGALWSSLTLAENIALPLQFYSALSVGQIRELAEFKLSLVGLADFADFYPSQISGGMRKRAALARAIALDPDIIFFDEPAAGLDPVNARSLDNLILYLRDVLSATIVVVTHELATIFAVGTNTIFIDALTKTIIAQGCPKDLLADSKDTKVIQFLTSGVNQGVYLYAQKNK